MYGTYKTHLVAMILDAGAYHVVSQVTADIDVSAVEKDGFLHDASYDAGYVDKAAVIQKVNFPKYFLPDSRQIPDKARHWYATLPDKTMFILVHCAQWESGADEPLESARKSFH